MKFYKRTLSQSINKVIKTFPAVLVTGPRQSGKTTLLKKEYSNTHRFVSFENPDVRERALTDPNGFFNQYKPPLILDEIQYIPEILSYIKTQIDENRKPGQWLLTGSQSFSLMHNVSQSLAGRVAVLTLLPFSVPEAKEAPQAREGLDKIIRDLFKAPGAIEADLKGKNISFINWLVRGAYPEIRTNQKVDKQIWCSSYIQTYLERDVRQIVNVGDIHSFSKFLKLCAARTAQILSLSELARDTGVSVPTAKRWISVLETSRQIYLLPPYYKNFGKRIIKSPKIYFLDTALITYLLGLYSQESILNGPFLGPLMETVIVSEWLKAFFHRGETPSLYYWRSRDGLEVDLLVERNNMIYPMEIKSTSTLKPSHASNLLKWREISHTKTNGIIFANIKEVLPVTKNVMAVPWFSV